MHLWHISTQVPTGYRKKNVESCFSSSNRGGGTCRQKVMDGHGGVLLNGLLIMACSVCFLVEPKTTSSDLEPLPWAESSPISKSFPPSVIFKKVLQLDFIEAFISIKVPFFRITIVILK